MPRESGFYWIMVTDHCLPRGKPEWEVGRWDIDEGWWKVTGVEDGYFENEIQRVGPRIPEPVGVS